MTNTNLTISTVQSDTILATFKEHLGDDGYVIQRDDDKLAPVIAAFREIEGRDTLLIAAHVDMLLESIAIEMTPEYEIDPMEVAVLMLAAEEIAYDRFATPGEQMCDRTDNTVPTVLARFKANYLLGDAWEMQLDPVDLRDERKDKTTQLSNQELDMLIASTVDDMEPTEWQQVLTGAEVIAGYRLAGVSAQEYIGSGQAGQGISAETDGSRMAAKAAKDELFQHEISVTLEAFDQIKRGPAMWLFDLQRIYSTNELDCFPTPGSKQGETNNPDKYEKGRSWYNDFFDALPEGVSLKAQIALAERNAETHPNLSTTQGEMIVDSLVKKQTRGRGLIKEAIKLRLQIQAIRDLDITVQFNTDTAPDGRQRILSPSIPLLLFPGTDIGKAKKKTVQSLQQFDVKEAREMQRKNPKLTSWEALLKTAERDQPDDPLKATGQAKAPDAAGGESKMLPLAVPNLLAIPDYASALANLLEKQDNREFAKAVAKREYDEMVHSLGTLHQSLAALWPMIQGRWQQVEDETNKAIEEAKAANKTDDGKKAA